MGKWVFDEVTVNGKANRHLLHSTLYIFNFTFVAIAAGDDDMRLGTLAIEVSAHPCVVNERLRRGLQLYVAVDAAPSVGVVEASLSALQGVIDLGDDFGLATWRHAVRHVVLVGTAVVGHMRDLLPVDPEPPLRIDAANLQPNAFPGKNGWS